MARPAVRRVPSQPNADEPRAAHHEERRQGEGRVAGQPSGQTILIADDNERIRWERRSVIESHTPCRVCGEATDGRQAVEKARALQPDLLILDLTMPAMNGLEVATELRSTK